MRVIVIGAGIGGLTLAQALRRVGIEVSVHDRDPAAEATGGYRLHLDERACAALQRHLAPAHYQALLGSSADASRFGEFTFADQRLRPLLVEATDPTSETLLVGRVPLRRLLAHGIDDAVRWGSTCTGYEADADGVTATFADGGTDRGDLLVAADGSRSRVVEQLAGRRMSAPVGTSALTGRTPLTPRVRALLPDLLDRSMVLAFSPEGTAVFLTVHEPDRSPVDPQACTDVAACTEDPYLVWGPLVPDERFPADVRDRDGEGLMALAHELLEGWADPLHALVDAAEPASVAFYPLFTADPGSDLTPWPAGRVTGLGDAVHAMPPTAGQAAATAIRDADLLARELTAADPATVPLAVHRYQRGMVGYGAQAVRESLAPLRGQERAQRLLGRRGLSVALPVAAAGARLRSVAGDGAGAAMSEPTRGPLRPDPELPLWEVVQTYHLAARLFTDVFAAVGLGATQFGVLSLLAETDHDPDPGPSQADLARATLLRPQSVGELVSGLLERGLVVREGPGGRGRRARLRITAAGRDALAAAVPGVNDANAGPALGLEPDEVTTLVALLRRVRTRLEESAP